MNTGLKCFHIFKRYFTSKKGVFITYAVWVQEITALLFIQTENNYKQIKINIMSNIVEVRIDETSFNYWIHSSYIHTHTHLYTYTHNSFFSSNYLRQGYNFREKYDDRFYRSPFYGTYRRWLLISKRFRLW